MAKMKVYELAQEIGVKSADILALLKNKGVEVKSHMSVLEDGQAEDVKKALKTPAKSEEAPKTTEKAETSKAAAPKESRALLERFRPQLRYFQDLLPGGEGSVFSR